jgi:hypothetical protein
METSANPHEEKGGTHFRWLVEQVWADAIRFGAAIVVEHRCIADIVTSIAVASLSVDRVSS